MFVPDEHKEIQFQNVKNYKVGFVGTDEYPQLYDVVDSGAASSPKNFADINKSF